VIGNCFVLIAEFRVDQTSVRECFCESRIEANGLVETGHRLIKFSLLVVSQAARIVNTRDGEVAAERKRRE